MTITRLWDKLTLIVDNYDNAGLGIERNRGDKTSALETTARLGAAAAGDRASVQGCLLPIFADLMMDNLQHEWPMPNYTAVD